MNNFQNGMYNNGMNGNRGRNMSPMNGDAGQNQNPGNNYQNPANNSQYQGGSPQNTGAPAQNAGASDQNPGTAGQNPGNTGNPDGTPLTGQSSSGNDSWKNDPSLKNMDLKKLAFLSELVSQSGGQSMDSLLPFLMSANKNANSMGMQFNDSETDLILNVLKSRMKPEEQSRIDMIRKMADMLGRK